ncbi:netrin receptor UNC5B-b-like [Acropora muricata]|uniref:netrin receptor UNC5B-b-like n=1 Tax=Acropora muricata TaxID=159855 RepID=UPI0034E5CD20
MTLSLWSELLFVTSAHDNFDNSGGKLTHPDSDVCISIEPGTFPDGKQQLFFHVIYNDKVVIQDIPETNERTLISPVIKCEPDDINPQKAVEIVLPHCLYVDEVNKGSIEVYRCGQFTNEGPQTWEVIPSSSESSCHSKAWFSIKEDSIVIKTKVFSIWSVFVCGEGGSMRKRVTAFVSKPNPEGNLISLRWYIYSDNEDSKRKVERLENEHFPGNKRAAAEKPFKLFNDDQDITVWLDKDALTAKGWILDEIPASQIYSYEMAYRNGFRSIYACEFPVKPIANCFTGVEDFSCVLHFQQIGHAEDYIYVNPGIPLLPLQTTPDVNASNSYEAQSQHSSSQASTPVISSDSYSPGLVVPEDLPGRFDEPVKRGDCVGLCNHIVNDWKMILRHLGVEEAVLDNVDANHSRANEKSFQGLLEWIRSAGAQGATKRNLCNALRAVNNTEALKILLSGDDDARQPAHAIPETV